MGTGASMHDRIVRLYGPKMLRKSILSIRAGAGVIQEVLGGGRFKTALEIGTYRGVGAAELAQFVERVHTIDLVSGKLELNKARGDVIDRSHNREAFWRSLGIDNITLHRVQDDTEKAALVGTLDFDFALIDGAHDESVRNDFELVKRCGTVLFHDYDRSGVPHKDCVIDFIETLPAAQRTPMDIFCLWTDKP